MAMTPTKGNDEMNGSWIAKTNDPRGNDDPVPCLVEYVYEVHFCSQRHGWKLEKVSIDCDSSPSTYEKRAAVRRAIETVENKYPDACRLEVLSISRES